MRKVLIVGKKKPSVAKQMAELAKRARMSERAAWTGAMVLSSYVLWKSEGFSGGKISRILNHISELEGEWDKGNIDVEEVRKILCNEYGMHFYLQESGIGYTPKSAYDKYITAKAIEVDNGITVITDRYMAFFFKTLIDVEKYGKKRLGRVQEKLFKGYEESGNNSKLIYKMNNALLDGTGVKIEFPKDWAKEGV